MEPSKCLLLYICVLGGDATVFLPSQLRSAKTSVTVQVLTLHVVSFCAAGAFFSTISTSVFSYLERLMFYFFLKYF